MARLSCCSKQRSLCVARRLAARSALGIAVALLASAALGLPAGAGAQVGHLDRAPALQGDLVGIRSASVAAFGARRSGRARARAADAAPAWCGRAAQRDDTRHDLFHRARTIKLVYAYPRGRPNRFRYFARLLQADVGVIDAFVAQQSEGRKTVRFDLGTGCGPQYVDIQLLRLEHRASAYMDSEGAELVPTVDPGTRLQREIARATRGERRHNYLVYVDGLNHIFRGDPQLAWGMTDVLVADSSPGPANGNNRPGRIAAIFGPDRGLPPLRPQGFASRMLLHELLHSLGAVQDGAPHSTGDGHCTDGTDVMCYIDGGPRSGLYSGAFCAPLPGEVGQTLDCSRDDYFNPSPTPGSWLASHWNTYDSLFLAPCRDPRLRAVCAAAQESGDAANPLGTRAQAGPITSSDPDVVARPIAHDGSVLGAMTLRLSVRARDVVADASSGVLTLPAGLYRLQTCLAVLEPGVAPWSYCWSRPAGAADATALPESVTVPRPSTAGTAVGATVNVQAPDPSGRYETIASSDDASPPSSLAVPPLGGGR